MSGWLIALTGCIYFYVSLEQIYRGNTGMSIAYAVNDDLSISYTTETGEANYQTSSTTNYDVEVDSVQLAYSLGGATLSIARTDYENLSYKDGQDAEVYEAAEQAVDFVRENLTDENLEAFDRLLDEEPETAVEFALNTVEELAEGDEDNG